MSCGSPAPRDPARTIGSRVDATGCRTIHARDEIEHDRSTGPTDSRRVAHRPSRIADRRRRGVPSAGSGGGHPGHQPDRARRHRGGHRRHGGATDPRCRRATRRDRARDRSGWRRHDSARRRAGAGIIRSPAGRQSGACRIFGGERERRPHRHCSACCRARLPRRRAHDPGGAGQSRLRGDLRDLGAQRGDGGESQPRTDARGRDRGRREAAVDIRL